jgi:predicted neuraminidase
LGLQVRRLGNPVAWRDQLGRTHLFVVATGLGGWSASRIVQLRQDAPDASFEVVRLVPLSWLWNISHLVRALPLPLQDGGMVLPAYFELGFKYPLALRFSAQGDFMGLTRISGQRDLLQPTLLARSATDWVALMRDNRNERRVRASHSDDGGAHWQDLPDPGPANPDASLVGLALTPHQMLLVHNPLASGRTPLVLSRSEDALHWTVQETVAQGGAGSEFSYPSLAWADQALWVSFTDERQAIAWQRYVFR